MKITKLYQLIGDNIVEIPLIDIEELNHRLSNIENNYLKLTGGTLTGELTITNEGTSKIHLYSKLVDLNNVPDTNQYDKINFYDKNGERYAYIQAGFRKDGETCMLLGLYNKVNGVVVDAGSIAINSKRDGSPASISIPPPIENTYSNHSDTLKSSINRHVIKKGSEVKIYLGGDNASDTDGLFMGRGFSPDKPFASFRAALSHLVRNYTWEGTGKIILQDDITLSSSVDVWNLTFGLINIESDNINELRTINFVGNSFIQVRLGSLRFININFTNSSANTFLASSGYYTYNSHLSIGGKVNFSGTVSLGTILATRGGSIIVEQNAIIGGNVTGPRYHINSNGVIDVCGAGANALPGSIAGTCDANSKYF